MAAIRTNDAYLAAQYARLRPRRGHKKALGAVKHSILIACWHMLSTGELYVDLGGDYFRKRDPERATKRLVKLPPSSRSCNIPSASTQPGTGSTLITVPRAGQRKPSGSRLTDHISVEQQAAVPPAELEPAISCVKACRVRPSEPTFPPAASRAEA
ncbi:MAG: hypothetical protein ACLP8S_10280 [Solirubrobacteraceae bacterium]